MIYCRILYFSYNRGRKKPPSSTPLIQIAHEFDDEVERLHEETLPDYLRTTKNDVALQQLTELSEMPLGTHKEKVVVRFCDPTNHFNSISLRPHI